MTTPLLSTKLYIPPTRPELVSRPRLIERLNAGLDRKLTLISAPAGFGKTMLLSEWIHRRSAGSAPLQVAWFSLDEGDNDPARFLAYFVAALQMIETGIGEGALGALQSPQPPPVEAILTALVNEITAISGRFVLVLDDYHVLRSQAVHSVLSFLLDHLPPQMHLIIAGRADPPLALALLRGRGQLLELRESDLRFTAEEASAFLNRVMGLQLSAENVAALKRRTEGWITGLQLAAIAMQGRKDTHEFVDAFAGSHRYVLDYLTEEVLQRQSEAIQTFLFQTSVLDRLTGPLCDAIVGQINDHAHSQTILEHLESSNLFVVPLDDERRWYRYHHLFADLLRARLEQAQPDLLPELHRRASAWYEQNGLEPEAINHALAARDFANAVRLLVDNAWTMLTRGEIPTLMGWLDALPDEVITAWPWTNIYRGWALALSGQLSTLEPHLQHTEEILLTLPLRSDADELGIEAMQGSVSAIRAWAARLRGDVPASIELSNQALAHLPEGSKTWRLYAVVALNLGLAYWLSGDAAAMAEATARAAQISQSAGDIQLALVALSILGQAHEMQGRLGQAADTYRQVLQMADEHGARKAPFVGLAHVGLAGPLLQWNDLESAMRHVIQAIELGKRGGTVDTLQGAYQTMSMVRQAQGDINGALQAIHEARQLAQRYNLTQMVLQLKPFEVRLRLAQGDIASASRWVQENSLDAGDDFDYTQRHHYTTLARVLVAQGKHKKALRLLKRLQEADKAGGRIDHLIRLLILQALALQGQGKITQAVSALKQALSFAQPEGYVRIFRNEGEPMAALLREAAARGIAADYVNKLLAAFDEGISTSVPLPPSPPALIEPLSDRELEVLGLITNGLSNQEIADELVIAVSTVKSHVNHILGKLDVKNRTQAAARAREMDLL